MKASFVQLGKAIDFIPSRDIASGEVLVCNGMAGVVKIPVKTEETGALHLSGIYDIDKAAGQINAGDKVFYDTSAGLATSVSTGNIYLGVASATSPENLPKVRVILNFGHPESSGTGSSESIQWQTLS